MSLCIFTSHLLLFKTYFFMIVYDTTWLIIKYHGYPVVIIWPVLFDFILFFFNTLIDWYNYMLYLWSNFKCLKCYCCFIGTGCIDLEPDLGTLRLIWKECSSLNCHYGATFSSAAQDRSIVLGSQNHWSDLSYTHIHALSIHGELSLTITDMLDSINRNSILVYGKTKNRYVCHGMIISRYYRHK